MPEPKRFSANFTQRLLITLVIVAAWLTMVKLRPVLISPHCVSNPTLCAQGSVNLLDRMGMGENSSTAEDLSTATQVVGGVLCFLLPWVFWLNKKSAPRRWWLALEDFVIIGQIVALNGALTELSRLIAQRPRPFVYENPGFYGQELQNYTSFVSGHTSFSAASAAAFVVVLIYRKAKKKTVWSVAILGALITISTAVCRVLAGRHFITDALAGAACGILAAAIVGVTSTSGRYTRLPEGYSAKPQA
jgi:membrane-associated phospholipid phosphatase